MQGTKSTGLANYTLKNSKGYNMKALIIKEEDIQTLHQRLELEKFKIQERGQAPVDQIYRHFNYVVRTWFEEQGR